MDVRDGDLVQRPEAFQIVSVHLARGRPALGAAEDDHGPARPLRLAALPRLLLDLADLQHRLFQGGGHGLVHSVRVVALDEQRGIAVSDEQRLQLLTTDTGQERGVVDLVAVELQDRQHRPVADRVEELVAVPARGERASFGLAVPDHGESDQVRVVQDCPVGVGDAVAQFAALVDAAGRFGRAVATDAAGERKLLEETPHSRQILTLVWVDLGIGPLEPTFRQYEKTIICQL